LKPRLIIVLLVLVLLPIGALAWLGWRVARDEQEIVRSRFRQVLVSKLTDTAGVIERLMDEKERRLLQLTNLTSTDTGSLRTLVRKSPGVSQIFVLDSSRRWLHPPLTGPITQSEKEFFGRVGQMWEDRHIFYQEEEAGQRTQAAGKRALVQYLPGPASGWYSWYWGSGINLVFWRRDASGAVVGAELNRARLLADVVAELPHAGLDDAPLAGGGLVVLADAKGAPLYQWGAHQPAKDQRPVVTHSLNYPLNAWTLQYYAPPETVGNALGGGVLFSFVSSLAVLGVALVGLAVYFYREHSREMREARQRVSFVNQVSHELKTPLTNIRMYAELLERRLDDADTKAAQQLAVIVSQSQRLSRLINNVLTFARQQRKKLKLRATTGVVDDIIRSALEHFRPSLEEHGVEVLFDAAAGEPVQVDADLLEQVLANLFSNVEKYAASGGYLAVRSEQDGARTVITVSDRGPGVPDRLTHTIFQPFRRASDKLSEGLSGTGIGLTIARDLARLHGGDLTLEPAQVGACFRLTLRTDKPGA